MAENESLKFKMEMRWNR